MSEQKSELTDLQQAIVEHDNDMARLDRNTLLPEVAHEHRWHTRRDAPSYCCIRIGEVEPCTAVTTDTPVSQPSGEAPERVWLPISVVQLAAASPELENVEGAYYVRAPAPDSIAEKARRAAQSVFDFVSLGGTAGLSAGEVKKRLADFIAAEFGGEDKS